MVFSGEEAASCGMGHKGDVTGGDPDAIRSVTGADFDKDDTGDTQGNVEAGTGEEIEDAILRGPMEC